MSEQSPPSWPSPPPPPGYGPPFGAGAYPPPGYPPQAAGPKPNSYLPWAIISTLFCCLPFGIVAIVNATKVDSLWITGQYQEAHAASEKAKRWVMVSAGVAVALAVGYVVLMVAIGLSVDPYEV